MTGKRRFIMAITALLLLTGSIGAHAQSPSRPSASPWAITFYNAIVTGQALRKLVIADVSIGHTGFAALAVSRRIASLCRSVDVELEGEFIQHYGAQDHQEINVAAAARFTAFPWNHVLKTTIAIGGGLSYATKVPELERRHHARQSQLLHNLNLEISFALPSARHWSIVTRLHHRSGAAGLFNGVAGGSNAIGLGVKYAF